jgi:hypothetical protein
MHWNERNLGEARQPIGESFSLARGRKPETIVPSDDGGELRTGGFVAVPLDDDGFEELNE